MVKPVEVPSLGESVTEAIVANWLKEDGAEVAVDEPICELETDKAMVDVPAPVAGVLHRIKSAGETAQVGEVIAEIEPASGDHHSVTATQPPDDESAPPEASQRETESAANGPEIAPNKQPPKPPKKDFQRKDPPRSQPDPSQQPAPKDAQKPEPASVPTAATEEQGIRRVPMSAIRRSIAERLVRAQQTAAMLTTFNEVDMTAVQEVRTKHGQSFEETHGVKLGITSFFARACAIALQQYPNVNGQIDQDDILLHDYVNLGVAVSTERGLLVPVLQHVEHMSLAQIETELRGAATSARDGKLSLSALSGGTFTITNGGVFGSLLSTPRLNPPQSGILGLHAIQERPIAFGGQVVIRPMMYVALTYDHRLVDGEESVSFLVRVKQLIEDPMQMML